ncbi:MAG: bis(5'-nucleosyl)-tetraphosphatase (symmetrical) YqeK [Selenomonadaceae bacterium]|nr:bis(5'-nucleosyl)-tetraphosphatase (symmetrical) YqeK [Selenomonadaceae bacterium]
MTIDEMRRELQGRLKKSRFAHSIGVANTAVKLAKKFGVDEQKAYIAGLLHDCAREFENEDLQAEAIKRGIIIGEVEISAPLLLHAYIGAQMVTEIYGVDDKEIIQAIYRHTVGAKNMSALDKIIYFADMIEPNRNYPGVDKLRELADKSNNLDEIILTALSESIIFVVQKNALVHPATIDARNFLLLSKENPKMMYPFLTLNDDTEIVHSEILPDNSVKVYVETPDSKDGFHHMTVYLPDYRIEEIYRYTQQEVEKYLEIIRSTAHLIIRFARGGGFENAPDF